jgi:hypothetical protein
LRSIVLSAATAMLMALSAAFYACVDRVIFAPAEGFAYHEPDPRYEALFPYYVELCAVSQFRSKQFGPGGIPGHAGMYLKGACRDTDVPYPKLRRCTRNATDPGDPEHGAGISVNRWFRSVNWIAVSSRSVFFDGDRRGGEPVTEERREATVRDVLDAGVFRGVELWPVPGQEDADLTDFVRRQSYGTDFAVRVARSAVCGRVPVESEMLDEIIHFLNDLNREYATGAADYRWSGFSDNCAHTLRNALAAASIWSPTSVRTTKLRQLFHLAIPANEAFSFAALGTMGPVDSYPRIFADDAMRNALLEFGWLPTRHGAVLVSLPVRGDNALFDPIARMLVFQGPVTKRATRKLWAMLEDPRFTELDANLRYFDGVYARILANPAEDALASLRGDRYRRIRRRYTSLIESELAEVRRMRAQLGDHDDAGGAEPHGE